MNKIEKFVFFLFIYFSSIFLHHHAQFNPLDALLSHVCVYVRICVCVYVRICLCMCVCVCVCEDG
jgi:hypothetical protein